MVNMLAKSSEPEDERLGIGGNKPPKVHELFASELIETYGEEFKKAEPIAKRANDAPEKIASDEDLKLWTGIYLDADQLFRELDGARLNEQRPVVAVLKAVFGPTLERLTRVTEHARKISDAYNREKVKKQREEQDRERQRLLAEAREREEQAKVAAEFGDTEGMIEHAQAAASTQVEAARVAAEAPTTADVARVRADEGMSTATGEWKFEIADYSKVDLNAIRQFFKPADIDKAVRQVVKIQKGQTKIEGVRVFEDVATQFRRR